LRKVNVVFQRDFKELRRTNVFLIVIIVIAVITIAASVIINVALSNQEWLRQKEARPMLELIIGLAAYFLSMFILIAFIWAFAGLPIIKEKVNGNITSLLATPLSPKEIWIGKSLAIFLPGFVISTVSTMIVLLSVNFITISPVTGNFVLPVPLLVTSLLVNPLLFFGLILFIVLFSLANSPDIAIAPSFLIGFGLMIGIPLGIATGIVNLSSWTFLLWYLAGAAVIWVVVFCLLRLLTRENIVLSGKGD
jgi:ABC-type transport system involved in multi-copper enzyme maturation permease subunit